ncbi:hypothetical protein B484DRAFT_28235 [Ochromonadaceae sp. CCMP2298]|nr:hypothetical protein B484DRAFT_28235 [Ochromonadaceae sp. CCMP2298]
MPGGAAPVVDSFQALPGRAGADSGEDNALVEGVCARGGGGCVREFPIPLPVGPLPTASNSSTFTSAGSASASAASRSASGSAAVMSGVVGVPGVVGVSEVHDMSHRHFSGMHWLFPGILHPSTTAAATAATIKAATAGQAGVDVEGAATGAAGGARAAGAGAVVGAGSCLLSSAANTLRLKQLGGQGGHTGWSAAWEACLWARLGGHQQAATALTRLLTRFTAPNLLTLHPPLASVSGASSCSTCFVESEASKDILWRNRAGRAKAVELQLMGPCAAGAGAGAGAFNVSSICSSSCASASTTSTSISSSSVSPRRQPLQTAQELAHSQEVPARPRGMTTDGTGQFQLDANMGLVALVVELLLQSHAPGTLQLLPALGPELAGGSSRSGRGHAYGLRARGHLLVSLAWERDTAAGAGAGTGMGAGAGAGAAAAAGVFLVAAEVAVQSAHPWLHPHLREDPLQPGFYRADAGAGAGADTGTGEGVGLGAGAGDGGGSGGRGAQLVLSLFSPNALLLAPLAPQWQSPTEPWGSCKAEMLLVRAGGAGGTGEGGGHFLYRVQVVAQGSVPCVLRFCGATPSASASATASASPASVSGAHGGCGAHHQRMAQHRALFGGAADTDRQ